MAPCVWQWHGSNDPKKKIPPALPFFEATSTIDESSILWKRPFCKIHCGYRDMLGGCLEIAFSEREPPTHPGQPKGQKNETDGYYFMYSCAFCPFFAVPTMNAICRTTWWCKQAHLPTMSYPGMPKRRKIILKNLYLLYGSHS